MDESCVDYQTEEYRCPFCKGEITDDERRMGDWKPTAQGEWSGYWIPLWIAPWMPARKISEAKRTKTPEFFANFVAGLPYAGNGAKVNPQDIYKNIVSKINKQEGTIVIGVDTGLPIYYMIMNEEGVFFHGDCKDYAELEKLMARYPKAIIVSDQGGDLIGIRSLQEKYPGRVFLCYYRRDRKTQEIIRWGKEKELGTVVVDRNRMIQLMIDQLRDGGRIRFNGTQEDWKPLADHFGNIYRTSEEKDFGTEYKWERNGPDHKVHTLLYCLVGMDRFGGGEAQIIGGTDMFEGIKEGRIFYEDY